MPAVRVPAQECVRCGAHLSGVSRHGEGESEPGPESVSICFYCGNVAVFDEDLQLRAPEPDELVEILAEPSVCEAFGVLVQHWSDDEHHLKAPCGCMMDKQGEVGIFVPCSATCSVFGWYVEEARKRGIDIVISGKM